MRTPEDPNSPLLAVDVDGVISLFGFEETPPKNVGGFQIIDGIPHFIATSTGPRLLRLGERFDMVWATGWEDKANDYLPHLLGVPHLPALHFGPDARFGTSHWKLGPIGAYAVGRPLAWIDDSFSDDCYIWARKRAEPTLLVPTEPAIGLEEVHVEALLRWVDDGFQPG